MRALDRSRLVLGLVAAAALTAAGLNDSGPQMFVKQALVPPAGAPDFAADRVVVKFEQDLTPLEIDATFGPLGARWLHTGVDHAFDVLRVESGTVPEWVAYLSSMPGVTYAEPDYVCWASGVPNDPYYKPYQWNFFDYGELSNGYASNYGVQGESTWNTTTGSGVIVAIVDTGVAYENFGAYYQAPDLAGATFVSPYDFVNNDAHANDDNRHGTHVCGTVRQATNNGIGVAGLAHNCSIMPVKVLNSSGSGTHSQIADGIRWAANNGAFAINMSLSGPSGSTTLQSAVDYAWNAGCVLCAASGNTSGNGVQYPAKYTNCIAVGATRFDGKRCTYSTWGTGLDVVAPGGDTSRDQNHDGYGDGILQQTFSGAFNNWGYYFFEGTSMATPHVTAIAALVKSKKPTFTNSQVRSAIETTTTDLGTPGYDTKYGNGLVNALAATQ